jgi:hypothetical protein
MDEKNEDCSFRLEDIEKNGGVSNMDDLREILKRVVEKMEKERKKKAPELKREGSSVSTFLKTVDKNEVKSSGKDEKEASDEVGEENFIAMKEQDSPLLKALEQSIKTNMEEKIARIKAEAAAKSAASSSSSSSSSNHANSVMASRQSRVNAKKSLFHGQRI